MERHINTYQGMNKDTAADSIPNSMYLSATDIRITTTDGDSQGAWTNVKGNKQSFSIPTAAASAFPTGNPFGAWIAASPEIIGYTIIRDRIIILVADNSDTKGWIYDVQYDPYTRDLLPNFPSLLYYNPNLNFSKSNPIEALGRYENANVQRVYWTDYNNYFRSINIEDPNLTTLGLGVVDIFPDVIYKQALLKNVFNGGVLLTGLYQVAYKLRTFDGKETLISPPSNLIHVVPSSESLTQSAQYVGAPSGTVTTKALNIEIDTTTYGEFKEMDVFLIFHENLNGVPEVKYIETKEITGSTLEFVITGTEASFPIELLEYTSKSYPFKTPKTITQKDNSLIIANLKKNSFSAKQRILELGETFDFDLLRYLSDGTTACNDKFNQDYNLDAHWDSVWHSSKQFKFKTNGTTLGGESTNIDFNFHLEPISINASIAEGFSNISNSPIDSHTLDDKPTPYYNTTFPSNSSPFISGLLKGFKRGETYRFGIVFYNKKGEASFVEHLGDIKFPDISEQDGVVNASGTNYFPISTNVAGVTVGWSLGLEFKFDFSTCPLFMAEVESYQIVRVKRELQDTRRLTTGVFKTFADILIGNTLGGSFDFRNPGGSGAGITTLHLYADTGINKIASRFDLLDSGTSTPYGNIVGDFLAYHTPEISYNYKNIPDLITSIPNACLLVTGGYTHPIGLALPTINLSGPETLCAAAEDFRATILTTVNTTPSSIEYVKQFQSGALYAQMFNSKTYLDNIAGPIVSAGTSYYLRNYYATYNTSGGGTGINDPQTGAGPASYTYEVSKGATGILTRVQQINIDPISQAVIIGATTPYFDSVSVQPDTALAVGTIPIADVLLPKQEIYGGFTDDALLTNIFIPCSPVILKSFINPKVFGGDIFISSFSFQSSSIELDPEFYDGAGTLSPNAFATSRVRSAVIPIESTFNIELAYGATLKTGVKYTESIGNSEFEVLRQETNNSDSTNGTDYDMYVQNTAFNKENQDVTFFVAPSSTDSITDDLRGYLSNVKFNGEVIDSWTKFGINNFYDIDDYGPINKILNYKDNVFFFQDRAVGVYAINRAAITTTEDGVPTQLGTGQGFGKHQYYTKVNGSIHQWGVKATDTGIYFLDGIHKKLFMISGQGNNPLSEIKGIHSWLQKLPSDIFKRKENGGDNPILKKGITIGNDIINDEVIFTFLGTGTFSLLTESTTYTAGTIVYSSTSQTYYLVTTTFTTGANKLQNLAELLLNSINAVNTANFIDQSIVYDELAQQFSSHYSANPKIWIENGNILQSPNPSNPAQIFTHNIGNWGSFYGVNQNSSITIIINPNADINKVLRTLEFNSIVRDDNKVIDRTKTITGFKIENEYQTTGVIPFSSGRIKRRFDKWRVKIPRDQNSINDKARLRSSYFIVTLYFDNTGNKQIIMNRLMSYYDVQIF